jgi:hypothetical protein
VPTIERVPHIRLIQPDEATGELAEEYEAAVERAASTCRSLRRRRERWHFRWHFGPSSPSRPTEKPCLQGFSEADEGTRTLDLLHGKQTL